jgi:hypothetical protein
VPRVTAALARWQDELGAGQDLAVARDVAAQAMARPGVPSEAAVRATALIDAWRVFSAPRPHGRQRIARRSLQVLQALSAAISASRAGPPVDEHAIAIASEPGDAAAGQDDESPSPKSDPPAAMQ